LRRTIESETDLALPVIVLGEYLYGIRHSRLRARYDVWLQGHLRVFMVLSVGTRTAQYYSDIRSELKAQGRPIPSNDVWIAALSREHGYVLLTRDGHFSAVRGLRLLGW